MANATDDASKVNATLFVHVTRLQDDVFELQTGDIYAAYCGEVMSNDPKAGPPTVPVFRHDGILWTKGGGCYSLRSCSASCYPLISPEDYHGPDSVPYSYEGRTVLYKRRRHRLGPRTEFCSLERTVPEYRALVRRMYERGGYFTAHKTYHEVLREIRDRESWDRDQRAFVKPGGNLVTAIHLELETPDFDKHKRRAPAQRQLLQPELLTL